MKKHNFLRGVLTPLLFVSLIGFAATRATWATFGNPENIKSSLSESGVYSKLPEMALDSATQQEKADESGIPPAMLLEAAKHAFTAHVLESSTKNFIDGIYSWLSGRSDQPDFRIDLSVPKQNFANTLGALAVQRVENLPPCTVQQLRELRGKALEEIIFTISCRPPTFNAAEAQAAVAQGVMESEEILPETVITAETLSKDEQGQTVFQRVPKAPAAFQRLQMMPWLLLVLSILIAIAVVLTYAEKILAARRIGIMLLAVSGLLFIGRYAGEKVLSSASQRSLSGDPANAMEPVAKSLAQSLSGVYGNNILNTAVILGVLGAVFVIGYILVTRRNKSDAAVQK